MPPEATTTAQTAAGEGSPAPKLPRRRPGFHLFPYAGTYRYDLIARFLPALWPQVERWATTALPIPETFIERTGRLTYEREDLARILKVSDEWDGYILAERLTNFGWQSDAALVALLHRWSCDCHGILCRESESRTARRKQPQTDNAH